MSAPLAHGAPALAPAAEALYGYGPMLRMAGEVTAPAKRLTSDKDTTASCPSAVAYFDALPHGWGSFPACRARASLLRTLRDRGSLDALDSLPAPLRPLLDHLRAAGEWIPEVVHVATVLAVRDARFGTGARADHAFSDWLGEVNRQLFEAPPYVGVISVESPGELLPLLPMIWETLHAGIPVTVTTCSPMRATAQMTYPRQLFSPLTLESVRRSIALLLAKTGAAQAHVDVQSSVTGDETRTVFEMTWR